jgi:hypothetical protein
MPETVPPHDDDDDDDVMTIDVDFGTWARVSSKMLRRSVADRARLIHDAGFDATWKEIDEHWFFVLSQDIRDGRMARVDLYAALCRDELDAESSGAERLPGPVDKLDPPPQPNRAARTLHSETPPFARDLSPPDIEPVRPGAGQQATGTDVHLGDDIRDGMLAAEEALSWPLEKYAWLCAELKHAPDRAEHVWALHGLAGVPVRRAVEKAWDKRLDRHPDMREKHDELVTRYTNVLRGE